MGVDEMSDMDLEKEFVKADRDHSGYMNINEFDKYCKTNFGNTLRVVIKFMAEEDQYRREIKVREQKGFDNKYVVGVLPGPIEKDFYAACQKYKIKAGGDLVIPLAEYSYGFVMNQADRSLDAIFRQERPDKSPETLQKMMAELAAGVQHVHQKGVMHGDLKMMNAIRIMNRLKLIDMDAAATISKNFAGAKFSSGVLPPEMFYQMNEHELDSYISFWTEEIKGERINVCKDDSHKQLVAKQFDTFWNKIEPRSLGKLCFIQHAYIYIYIRIYSYIYI
jgi:serine/threonine protein kinase